MPGKDIENKCGAINYLHPQYVLEIFDLRRGKLIVRYYQIGIPGLTQKCQFRRFSRSDISARFGCLPVLRGFVQYFCTGCPCQFLQFIDRCKPFPMIIQADKNRPLVFLRRRTNRRRNANQRIPPPDLPHQVRTAKLLHGNRPINRAGLLRFPGGIQKSRIALRKHSVPDPYGSYGIKPHLPKGIQIHPGQPSAAVGMGMDASGSAQARLTSPQSFVGQGDLIVFPDGNVQNLSSSVQSNGYLPIDLTGPFTKQPDQFLGKIIFPVH